MFTAALYCTSRLHGCSLTVLVCSSASILIGSTCTVSKVGLIAVCDAGAV
jgi:hypothetical protein